MATDHPERALALSYAVEGRAAAAAIFALDDRLATILRAARDPLIGQMRLTWWHGAITALDTAPPPAEPLLQALARDVLPAGPTGADLAALIEGWEALLDHPLTGEAVSHHGDRGRALFAAVGRVIGAVGDPVAEAGVGWALADLSRHISDDAMATLAADAARPWLDRALAVRWSRRGRALGVLAHLARLDLGDRAVRPGSPRRIARMLRHRLTGR